MAHELSIQTIDGREIVEAMYANRPAWHDLGVIFDPGGQQAPDSETTTRLGHLGWLVDKEPVFLADGTLVPGQYATVRQDTRDILGVVTEKYQVVQNHEAFSFMDSLLQDGIMRYESAMALRGGRIVALLARMPSVDPVADGDALLRYIMFSTSHDGTAAIHCLPTSVRVVCANTFRLAVRQDITGAKRLLTISHTGDIKGKLAVARQYLSQFDKAFTLYSEQAQLLATRQCSQGDLFTYLNEVFPPPKDEAKGGQAREKLLNGVFHALWIEPSQQIPSIKGTWWATYNGISHVIDHKKLRGKGDQTRARENRFLNVIDGPGAATKERAFEIACTMAGLGA